MADEELRDPRLAAVDDALDPDRPGLERVCLARRQGPQDPSGPAGDR